MKKLLISILVISIVIPAFGQRRKKDDEEAVPTFVEGIVYALPRTGVRVYVKVVQEKFVPGPYAAYAEQLLGITNAKNREAVKWSFEDVKMETFAEPDPDQVYKALGDASFLLNLTPDGRLAGINSEFTAETGPTVKSNEFITTPKYDDGFSFENFNDSPMYTTGDSTNNFRPVRKTVEEKASDAALRVLECRLNQYDIVSGLLDEFHPDGDAYRISLNELKQMEKNYLSLFTGRTTYSHEVFSFDFVPTASGGNGEIIFRFSDEKGVVPSTDLSGKPVMLKVEPQNDLEKKYTGLVKSDNPVAGESGVYYRMPGVGTVSLIYELKIIASVRTAIAQFGSVAPVPEELLFGDYSLKIHPETGAIESVSKK
ncbi:DUF4831 family protein [Maribellus maritimus]|uniref:DUF4831 family protein n=1 Tax=Maribellus maritimus TaxID=2870838 RepID=UPI001EEA882B|nr:DUF4831 family protein [Maribellus maritimus]MCG6185871.1 DUF4831 family protein [Maribellus maritimus]